MTDVITTKIAVFQKKEIRKIFHRDEWWFSIVDIIEVLTDTPRPRKYWSDLKKKLIKEGYSEVSEKIGQLKVTAPDGKKLELKSGKKVSTGENYLPESKKKRKLK